MEKFYMTPSQEMKSNLRRTLGAIKKELNYMNLKVSDQNKIRKLFGIGPTGAIISLFLLAIFVWIDSIIKFSIVADCTGLIKIIGILLVIIGLGLHFWSFSTLRSWWVDDKLCTKGPFKHFRHPMYAAWITFICPGIAIYLNSWIYFTWVFLLHLLWHKLVNKEEIIMINTFEAKYKDYARQTGRFFPKVLNYRFKD
jgi:protein-S-isoprenylcysteine O-methyltransferase Ste14